MNKGILSIFVSFLLLSTLNASEVGNKKLTHTDLEYDNGKGWWWYEETYIDEKSKKEEKIKYSMTPKEKKEMEEKKKTNELLAELVKEQRENKKINNEILLRLEYAFPNVTPINTINKKTGEPCVTNSSIDCFVMPVIAEAQQVPVLKDFISDPTPEHSKKWLQWQATYFNHVKKISHGLRFAYLKHGADAYPTTTTFARGDNLALSRSEQVQAHREATIIHSLKNNIALLNFVGENTVFEKNLTIHKHIHNWNSSFLKDIQSIFIFQNEKSRDEFLKYVAKTENPNSSTVEFWKNAKVTVRPDLYKQHNIKMTPSTVLFYEDKAKKINISETIASGSLNSDIIRKGITMFLTYNEIVEEKEFAAETNWQSPDGNINTPIPKPKSDGIQTDYIEEKKK